MIAFLLISYSWCQQISKWGWKYSEHYLMPKFKIYFGAEINTNTAYFQLSAKSEI